eukprot:Phypoly_transcript_01016.p1 GENE.Phypoly_transcript_01016~~Phypoly_transcript_01016.p1  ORF type:complete len:561 (-),score=69.04 Phypoly_transcript_01016:94-1776(-)
METIELLCHGLLREYLARKGCANTLVAFDSEQPRNENSITNRKILAQTLHIGKLITKNKERGELFTTFLEMIVDHLTTRYSQTPSEPSKETESPKEIIPSSPAKPPRPPILQLDSPSYSPVASPVGSPSLRPRHESATARGIVSRRGSSSNLRASLDLTPSDMSVSDLDDHDPADIGGTVRVPGSALRVRDAASPMRARNAASPLRSRDVSSPDLGAKRVGFMLDPPTSKKHESPQKEQGEDIVSKHARVYANGIVAKTTPKPEPEPAPAPVIHTDALEDVASIVELDKLVFGLNSRGPKMFQEEWHQGFFFSDCPDLKYGLVQLAGGPCGVIAAVQAYVLKELIFGPVYQKYGFNPPDNVRTTALVNALSEILWQAGGHKSAKLVLNPSNPKRFRPYKLVDWTIASFSTATELQQAIRTNLISFTERSGCGVLLFVYSAILSRGAANVRADMDVSDTPLLAPHKYCSQELVNLLTMGKASSNVFDGTLNMDGSTLKGITNRGTVGFLTLMEKMGYCQVGNHLKSPVYPIWILYSESHYSLLFATQSNLSAPKFDILMPF